MTEANRAANQALVEHVAALAHAHGATPGQVGLSADEIADLNGAAARLGVHGNRYSDQHLGLVGR